MKKEDIHKHLSSLSLSGSDHRARLISVFSAVIAVSKQELTVTTLGYLKECNFDEKAIYETILQSYLFLGFPRMIEAAISYNEVFQPSHDKREIEKISTKETENWFTDGINLCQQVYGKNYETLRDKFITMSPEIFRWMVIEGYGKVLTRSGLSSIERELAEVAALIVDVRKRQLTSHIIGSLNVGASMSLIRHVNEDIRSLAGEQAYELADKIILTIEGKYDTA